MHHGKHIPAKTLIYAYLEHMHFSQTYNDVVKLHC